MDTHTQKCLVKANEMSVITPSIDCRSFQPSRTYYNQNKISKRRIVETEPPVEDSEHLVAAFSHLSLLRASRALCDVTLLADDGGTVPAHKVVLAARCPYFRAMFSCGTREREEREVRLQGLSLRCLQIVVGFLYNEPVEIAGGDVQGLLSAAEMMDLGELKVRALKTMTRHITSTNCLAVWQLSELYSCNIAAAEARGYALRNFNKVSKTPDFLEISAGRLQGILSDDLLRVETERVVLDSLVRWFRHKAQEREEELPRLLHSVRLHLLETPDLVRAITRPNTGGEVPGLQAMLLHHLEPGNRKVCTVPGPPRNRVRRRVIHELAVIIGGHQESSIWSKTWGCDVTRGDSSSWFPLPQPLTRRRDHVAMGLGCDVIIAGGSDGSDHINNVERYDAHHGSWQELPGMLHARNHLCGTSLNSNIYVGGGTNDNTSYLASFEVLDTATMRWVAVAPLSTARRSCAATSLHQQLVVGGGAGNCSTDLAVVELYDPREGFWRQGPAMSQGRRGFGLVTIEDSIFAIGGYSSMGYTSSVEQLDIRTKTWTKLPDLPIKVGYFGCTVTSCRKVLICGGVSNSQLIVWDPASSQPHFTTLTNGPPLPYSGTVTLCSSENIS